MINHIVDFIHGQIVDIGQLQKSQVYFFIPGYETEKKNNLSLPNIEKTKIYKINN